MKAKLLTLLILLLSFGINYAQNTTSGGVRRGGTSMDMRNKMKERLKTELNLSDAKTDSVAAIQQTYQYKIRAVRMDTNLGEESKKSKVAELEGERKAKLKEVLTDDQITKLDSFIGSRRKLRADAQMKPE